MNISLMRWIDHQVGNVACSAFALAKRAAAPFSRTPKTYKTIAVMKFFGMGSIIVAAPALRALRAAYPDAKIIFVSFKGNREILNMLNLTDENVFIDNSSVEGFVRSTFETAHSLWKSEVDLAIDLEFFAKFPLVLASLASIPVKAGFHLVLEPWRSTLLDVKGSYNHYFHTKDIFLSLVYLLKTNDPYYVAFDAWRERFTLPEVTPSESDLESAARILARFGFRPGQRLIIVNPNAAAELAPEIRKWPEDRYADLGRRIAAEVDDAFVAFIGAPSEKDYVERIVTIARGTGGAPIVNTAGSFKLRELHALLSLATLFVTNDSGPMHLASLTDVPIIGLFFADSPTLFAPLSTRAMTIAPQLYSVPMFTVYTGKTLTADKNVPSHTVSVEQVMGMVRESLALHAAPSASTSIH